MSSPVLWGPNNISNNLQNGELLANGTLINSNGNINYITNGTCTNGSLKGYALYVDAAGAAPVSGAGTGTNTITFTSSTTAPLAGDSSFLLTKPASNAQGQGVAYAFTINNSSTAKVLQITADMMVASGTFVAGGNGVVSDVTVYIVNTTTGVVTQPSTYTINTNSATVPYQFNATFQTDAAVNGTSYRLCFHVASTSTAAYALQLDNISVSPSTYVYGTPITDWQAYTPTIVGFGTPTNILFYSRRVGSELEVSGSFTSGTATATIAQIPIGFSGASGNVTIDSSKIGLTNNAIVGVASYPNFSSTNFMIAPIVGAGANTYINLGLQNSTTSVQSAQNGSALLSSGQTLNFFARVPILGWSSSVQTSDQTDTRVVAASAYTGSNAQGTSLATVTFTNTTNDTHGAWSGSSYKVPVPGLYYVDFQATDNGAGSEQQSAQISKNGTPVYIKYGNAIAGALNANAATGGLISCAAGDLITFQTSNTTSTALNPTSTATHMSILRLSGPSAIASSESVNARYYGSTSTISSTSSPITYNTKSFDSHNAYSAGTYIPPISGKYQINCALDCTGTYALNNVMDLYIYQNGVAVSQAQTNAGGTISLINCALSDIIGCLAGDLITIKAVNTGTSPVVSASNTLVYFSIARVGN